MGGIVVGFLPRHHFKELFVPFVCFPQFVDSTHIVDPVVAQELQCSGHEHTVGFQHFKWH